MNVIDIPWKDEKERKQHESLYGTRRLHKKRWNSYSVYVLINITIKHGISVRRVGRGRR